MSAVISRPAPPAAASGGSPATASEMDFSAADFERVRQLIYQRAGISLGDAKQAMVYSRLSRRLRETRYTSFSEYLNFLQQGGAGDDEWQEFINCLTTNLTAFFREDHHFTALTEDLQALKSRPVRIWCNASSTGEEPYTLAMTCAEALGSHGAVQIVASDIDTKVLATAQRGVYAADARGLSPERLRRHFLRGTAGNSGFIRIKPELAKMIDFRVHNLMDTRWSLGEPFDIVFCRNVMIYFDADTQLRVLERMHAAMKPRALLYVGHSENFTAAKQFFKLRGKTIYEKV